MKQGRTHKTEALAVVTVPWTWEVCPKYDEEEKGGYLSCVDGILVLTQSGKVASRCVCQAQHACGVGNNEVAEERLGVK